MEARGWNLPADALERVETLLGLWLRYGAVMNLSGARSRADLLPHVFDGLDTAWLVRDSVGGTGSLRWVDFGSGGGFPGLLVAAVLDCRLHLLEPRQKRASFLVMASNAIGDSSTTVERARYDRKTWGQSVASEVIGAGKPERVIVSARAVWSPSEWLEVAGHVTNREGHVVMHLATENSPEKFGCQAFVESDRGTVGLVSLRPGAELR